MNNNYLYLFTILVYYQHKVGRTTTNATQDVSESYIFQLKSYEYSYYT